MIYFISDVHLGLLQRKDDKLREDLLLNLLNKIFYNCETLVLVGDIFDFWFDYKTVIPKYYYRTLAILYEYKKAGKEIIYLMGNHDFGHRGFFKEEFDIDVIVDDIEIKFYDKKFYLSHGDGKAYNDGMYKFIKRILRNDLAQRLYLKLHPDLGIKLASGSSKKSRKYTDQKTYGEKDGMRDFAFSKLESGFDYVIMGHRHKAEMTAHSGGFYINLGEWLREPKVGIFNSEKFLLEDVKKYLE